MKPLFTSFLFLLLTLTQLLAQNCFTYEYDAMGNRTGRIISSNCNTACDFSVSASTSNANPAANGSFTLSSSCSGSACTGISYQWSGNGINQSGQSISINAPGASGSYTYTVTASKSGCPNKTATVTITVGTTTGPCTFTDRQVVGTWNGYPVQVRRYTVNGSQTWLIVVVDNNTTKDRHYPRGANFADRSDISWTIEKVDKSCLGGGDTGWDGLVMPSGVTVPSGYVQGTLPDGTVYFETSGSGCTPPAAPSLSASSTSITAGQSSTLTASGCSGTVNWSTGQSGTSISVSPGSTTTYTATCTVNGCTSSNGSVTVTVSGSSGSGCGTGTGLTATYYSGHDQQGSPIYINQSNIDFIGNQGDILSGTTVAGHNISARWEGQVEAPVTGTYTFNIRTDDGVRMWFDGVQKVDDYNYYPCT